MKNLALLIFLMLGVSVNAQDPVYESFAGTRVINNHSTETLPKNNLEFIVAHKFGDIAGPGGGIENFFGFDNLADVRIAFEYGILDPLDIGLGRSKGVGVRTQVLDGYVKYKILQQKTSKMPLSLVFVGAMALPYGGKSSDSTAITFYPKYTNRFMYTSQLLISRKFGDRFTMQVNAGYSHRNYVNYNDKNGLLFAGSSARFRFTKTIGMLVEYNHTFGRSAAIPQQDHLAFSLELLTGGHIFALNFSNSRGVSENLFVTETTSNWLDGAFRFGFSINRRFKL